MFIEWLNEELQKRDWSQRELARRSGLSSSSVHHVFQGRRDPGTKFCKAIAKALHIPVEDVYREANLLPPEIGDAKEDMTLKEVWNILQTMDADQLREARRYLLYLSTRDQTPVPETATN